MNSVDRILGTLGHRGWRLKRGWALSRARDWWRADSSRRLTPGSLRAAGCCEAEPEEGGASPFRLVPPPARELAGEGVVVGFPPADEPARGADPGADGDEAPPRSS